MKRIILIILVCAPALLFAQIGGAIRYNYTINPNSSESLEQFFKSYNEYNAASISTPFKSNWRMLTGSGWHCSFFTGNNGFQYRANSGVSYLSAKNMVTLKNNDKRLLKYKSNDLTIDMGLGTSSDQFYFSLNFGMNLRMATLYSSYIFSDGTQSYGTDHKLNGVYEAWRLTGLLGATLGVNVGDYSQIVLKIDWVPPTQDDDTYKADFSDLTDFKDDNSAWFPSDVEQYVNDPIDFFNNSFNDLTGIRITIGFQLSIYAE